ncbi:EAL domain-containing protein [Desulfoplanes sp.]
MSESCQANSIRQIVDAQSILTYFQPVVSIRSESVIGFEAFSRGVVGDGQKRVDACALFNPELDDEIQSRIERICRTRALEKFKPICKTHPNILLFLNTNIHTFRYNNGDMYELYRSTRKTPFDGENIVIEINTAQIKNGRKHIDEFVAFHADRKFLLSLDDCQSDGQSMDKIHKIRPDFIKIGRSFFEDMDTIAYKRDILASLCKICQETGSHIVAKGVEEEKEAINLLECGIHTQQGFYYTKSKSSNSKDAVLIFTDKVRELGKKYREQTCDKIRIKQRIFKKYDEILKKCVYKLGNHYKSEFKTALKQHASHFHDVRGALILDTLGREIAHSRPGPSKARTEMLQGRSHASEDYYLYLTMGFEKFVTKPFFSRDSNALHCIISRPFYAKDGHQYMACLEFPYLNKGWDETVTVDGLSQSRG